MRIRRGFIKFPCLHGSIHLVTTTSPCNFSFSLHVSVPTRNQEIVPPSHHHTLPTGTPSHPTVPPATHMPQPCRCVIWCATQCTTMKQPYHCVTWCATVPPGAPPYHLVRHRTTWSATVPPGPPPWRRAAAVPTRHIGIPPYTHAPDSCQSYLYLQTLSDAISPYGLLLKQQ